MSNLIVGLAFLLAPLAFWWELWRTSKWPTTKARVIKVDPQSFLERGHDSYFLNLDSDYAIEYEVAGHKYVHTPDIEDNVRVAGVKVYRKPSVPTEFMIRYSQQDPSKYSIAHLQSTVLTGVVTAVCIAIGLVVLIHAGFTIAGGQG